MAVEAAASENNVMSDKLRLIFLQFAHGRLAASKKGKQAQPRFIRDRLDRLQ